MLRIWSLKTSFVMVDGADVDCFGGLDVDADGKTGDLDACEV